MVLNLAGYMKKPMSFWYLKKGCAGCIGGDAFHEMMVLFLIIAVLSRNFHKARYNLTCHKYLQLYPEPTNIAPPLGMLWKMILFLIAGSDY